MRVFLFLLIAAIAIALGSTLHGLALGNKLKTQNADGHNCRSGFFYREGWCTALSPCFYSFSGAVEYCKGLGAYSPSVHSKRDLDFWAGSSFDLTPRFWLDASCPVAGQPNKWRDGTLTDYTGPNGELQSCTPNFGFIITSKGFVNESYTDMNQAVCVYPVDPMPEPEPIDGNAQYCQCNYSAVELDVVFAVDSSYSFTEKDITDITKSIQTMLRDLSLGTAAHESNVALIAFGDNVEIVGNFGQLRSDEDIGNLTIPYLGGYTPRFAVAIYQAASMLSSSGRSLTRKVIVLVTRSADKFSYVTANKEAEEFKTEGGVVIIIDYAKDDASIKGVASPGYYLKSGLDPTPETLDALCDANCFCPVDLIPYLVPSSKGRDLPMGCFRVADTASVYDDADKQCRAQNGFVATTHDDAKNFFLLSLFPVKSPHWLGLRQHGSQFVWSDGSNDGFTWWAPGNPLAELSCVYAQQTVGFNTAWYSAPCSNPQFSLFYACQSRPYDAGYSGTP